MTLTKERLLEIAEKSCQTLMKEFTPETLPPAGRFHYHQSVFLMGMMMVYDTTGEQEYLDYTRGYFDSLIDDQGNLVFDRDQLDAIQVGLLLFKLYDLTNENKYLIATHKLRATLDTINRTSENGFWHKDKYPYQMWLDGLFMAGPFLVEYGKRFNQLDLVQLVLYQEHLMRKHMLDEKTGLLYHAWDEKKVQPWADPETGHSPEFWGRSNGWIGAALIDIYEAIGDANLGQEALPDKTKDFIDAVIAFQDPTTSLWYQVVDKGDREDNWLESSSSSLYLYTIAKAIENGFVDDSYEEVLVKGYQGLLEEMVDEEDNSLVVKGICIGTSAGTYNYYVERPASDNDLHGVGAFLFATMAYYNLLSK